MRGLIANLICKVAVPGCFTEGRAYGAVYETVEKDRGWLTTDDNGNKHWLSPWDGKDHGDIHQEQFVMSHFNILEVK